MAVTVVGLTLAACTGTDVPSPTDLVASFDHTPGEPPELHTFTICKAGTAATFEVTLTPQSTGIPDAPFQVSIDAGDCAQVARSPMARLFVSVTELVPAGTELDSIVKESFIIPSQTPPPPETITGTPTVSALIHGDIGTVATFFNSVRPPGDGCTPGFWKQSQHFSFWTAPFTTGTLVHSTTAFDVPANYVTKKTGQWLGGFTLLEGLSFKGGETLGGAAETLLRASIAAVLNAANPNVNYSLTASEIIDQVNDALASQDRATMLGLATKLDTFNNMGCTAKQ